MGCVSGAGTLASASRAKALVGVSQREAKLKQSVETQYKDMLEKLD